MRKYPCIDTTCVQCCTIDCRCGCHDPSERRDESAWIRIKDRLPSDQQRVICFGIYAQEDVDGLQKDSEAELHLGTFCGVGYWEHDRGFFSAQIVDVTHWMPLPQPPSVK